MSRSPRSAALKRRIEYTGEPKPFAGRGLGRKNTHGLDSCNPEQLRFRALFALFALNSCDRDQPQDRFLDAQVPGRTFLQSWGVNQFLINYQISLSAWYDELVVVSDQPHHLVNRVCPRPHLNSLYGIPGLRPLDADTQAWRWLRFQHVPTGALLRLQYVDPNGRQWSREPFQWRKAQQAEELHSYESLAMARVPEMQPDAERLLAGLAVRLTTQHPNGLWAVGRLTDDPLGRKTSEHRCSHYLWGHGSQWTLRWGGLYAVPASDVAAAFTDPNIGLDGAIATVRDDRTATVRYGAATLDLVSQASNHDEGVERES